MAEQTQTRFIRGSKIQRARARLTQRPLGVLALALALAEAIVALLGGSFPLLSGALLIVAPGLAFLPLLPARARSSWTAALAAAPALGLALSSVVLITATSAGLPLTGTAVRVVILVMVGVGLVAFKDGEPEGAPGRAELLAGLGLLGAVVAGAVLEGRVIAGSPLPGNDWAKYVLYADEIRIHGSLLIDNPYWLLGVPFREDPGVPALYGSYLVLTGQAAAAVAHGIWVFAVIQTLAIYSYVRACWGQIAGVLAAALWAVLPINQDILGWHGVANVAALALLALGLLYLTTVLQGRLSVREAAGFGLIVVSLAAAHRLSLVVGLGAAGLAIVVALAFGDRRRLAVGLGLTALATLVLAPGVAYELLERNSTFGGTQPYTAYLTSKVDVSLVVRDLTLPFCLLAAAAVLYALWRVRRDRALIVPLSVLVVVVALAYAWIVHLPLAYVRMAYFLPLALVPLLAVGLAKSLRAPIALGLGAALILATGVFAWDQGPKVKRFYAFANPASLRGLDAVEAKLRPGEVVATDRCWSFLSTWLLHTRTLPALDPIDIQPKAEVPRAREGRALLAGSPEGARLARRLGVRYVFADPTCSNGSGRALRPPRGARALYVSERLVILRLPGGP